jgi:hypothetical protein
MNKNLYQRFLAFAVVAQSGHFDITVQSNPQHGFREILTMAKTTAIAGAH